MTFQNDPHGHMEEAYASLGRASPEPCPDGVDPTFWANRRRISVRLKPHNHRAVLKYCRENDLSISSATNKIFELFFSDLIS